MLKITAPQRIDICGGITDIPELAKVFGTTITNIGLDLYLDQEYKRKQEISVKISRSQNQKLEIIYNNKKIKPDILKNDSFHLIKLIVHLLIKEKQYPNGLKIVIKNPFPQSTGLGGSAVITTSLILGLNTFLNKKIIINYGPLLKKAFFFEVEKAKIKGGFQDFIGSVFGKVNFIDFNSIQKFNFSKNKDKLGIIIEEEIKKYFNENSLILLLKNGNQSSDKIIFEEINNFKLDKEVFVKNLYLIKQYNKEVFNLLKNNGDIYLRLNRIGQLINKSWLLQKELSSFLGKGILGELELKLAPFVYGLRSPGAGVNSLFLLIKTESKQKVLEIIKNYKQVQMFYAKINETGIQIKEI